MSHMSQSLYSSGLLSHARFLPEESRGFIRFGLNPFIHQVFFPTRSLKPRLVSAPSKGLNPFIHQVFFPTSWRRIKKMRKRIRVSIPLFIRSSFPLGEHQRRSYISMLRLNPFIHQVFFPTLLGLKTRKELFVSQSLYSSGLLSH